MLFYLIYLELGFLSVPGLEVAKLARLSISFQCKVSVRSPYLVSFLFLCWITSGHTIHPPIEGLLVPTGIVPTPFGDLATKGAGLQVHVTTPGEYKCMPLHYLQGGQHPEKPGKTII